MIDFITVWLSLLISRSTALKYPTSGVLSIFVVVRLFLRRFVSSFRFVACLVCLFLGCVGIMIVASTTSSVSLLPLLSTLLNH